MQIICNNKNGEYMKKVVIIYFIIILYSILPAFCIEEHHDEHLELFNAPKVENGTSLSVKDCVALAYKNSPKIRKKKFELDIAKSNVGIAKSRYFPVIGAGVGFNYERNSDSIYYDDRYRDLPYVGITVNQLVYDFGKTNANIKMEQFFKIGAEYEFMDELCHTLFDIKGKYYNLLLKSALLKLAQKDIYINEEFVKISKGKPDKAVAELNLSNAKIRYINAEREFQNAKYNLSNAMYLDNNVNYFIKVTPTFDYQLDKTTPFAPVKFPFRKDDAADIAYKNSPDLQVLINTKSAMEQSLKYIKRSYLPDLRAGVGYGFNNTLDTSNNSLQVGVGLSAEMNLKELKHSIDAGIAEVNIADNEISLFKKNLYYEVQRALNNTDKTEKQVLLAQKEIETASANLELVKSGYNNYKLDYTALQNAGKDYMHSQKHYIDSLYDYNMSIIQTEMAMHYHIVDIHHKTEHALHNHSDELIEHLNEALNCEKKELKSKKKNKKVKL